MIIRHLIVPLAAAAFAFQSIDVKAQGAFPAPLPGAAAQRNDSAFPPVNGAAPTPVLGAPSPFPPPGAASPFPSAGAPPVGAFSQPGAPQAGPPGNDECMKGFMPLRQEAEKRGAAIKIASERRAPPEEACKLIGNFAQSEIKMIKYIESHAQKCGIPPQVGEQMKSGHKNTDNMMKKVCAVAQQQQQRGPAGPSLSELLGSSAVPEATAANKKSGGSTFDTLNGNVLTR